MTEEQLTGRALDAACAVAMGWTSIRKEMLPARSSGICGGGGRPGDSLVEVLAGNPPDGSSPPPLIRHVPRFSDNPATQAEKLAWLYERGDFVDIGSTVSSTWAELFVNADEPIPKATGDTIDEALARLVVAVAKERSK